MDQYIYIYTYFSLSLCLSLSRCLHACRLACYIPVGSVCLCTPHPPEDTARKDAKVKAPKVKAHLGLTRIVSTSGILAVVFWGICFNRRLQNRTVLEFWSRARWFYEAVAASARADAGPDCLTPPVLSLMWLAMVSRWGNRASQSG